MSTNNSEMFISLFYPLKTGFSNMKQEVCRLNKVIKAKIKFTREGRKGVVWE